MIHSLTPVPSLHKGVFELALVRPPADLDETERQTLDLICQASPTANRVYELVQDFITMLRHRKGERLDDWLRSVRDSHIRELRSFMIVLCTLNSYAFGLTPELIPAFDEGGIGWLELH